MNAAHSIPTILQIGPAQPHGFGDILTELQRLSRSRTACVETIGASRLASRLSGGTPDIVVVLQSWPDEFTARAVESLLTRWPLAQTICCYGPWCDSDGRTRTIWPLSVRIPVIDAACRIGCVLDVVRGLGVPLAVSASRDEAFAWDYLEGAAHTVPDAQPLEVVVHSPDRELAAAVGDGFRAANWRVCSPELALPSDETPPRSNRRVLLWDVDPPSEDTMNRREIEARKRRFASGTIAALAGFPRSEDIDRWRAAGIDAVCSKLTPMAHLIRGLHELIVSNRDVRGRIQ